MKEQLINFETAKLAKEKGFINKDLFYYDSKNIIRHGNNKKMNLIKDSNIFSAPTQSLLQKWLREKHGINVQSNTEMTLMWTYTIQSLHPNASYTGNFIRIPEVWSIYEEALEKGLQSALKLIQ